MKFTNSHSGMIVTDIKPDFSKSISQQTDIPSEEGPINGAGIITIFKGKDNSLTIMAMGKLNPCNNVHENSLALGGGFNFLENQENSSFATAINAAIEYKAPACPKLDDGYNNVSSVAIKGYCEQWGGMQYITLSRTIEVENAQQAIDIVNKINQTNDENGKDFKFNLCNLDEVLKSASLTCMMEEDNIKKGSEIEHKELVVTNLLTNEKMPRYVIFDDLATHGLSEIYPKKPSILVQQSMFSATKTDVVIDQDSSILPQYQ